jgi:hypothetical protein
MLETAGEMLNKTKLDTFGFLCVFYLDSFEFEWVILFIYYVAFLISSTIN